MDPPSGVRVRGGLVGVVRAGRGGFQIGLRVVVRGKVKDGFGEGGCV